MRVSFFALRRPVATLMLTLGVGLLGSLAFRSLPVDFLPSVQIPQLTVHTRYPNTAPSAVENAVTRHIESTLLTVAGATRVRSVTREGVSAVTVDFDWGTAMDDAVIDVREKLDRLRGQLPRDAGRPTILRVDPATEPIMTIALSAPGMLGGLTRLKETAHAVVKRRIEQAEGIAQAAVLGGEEREVHVDIDIQRTPAFGVTLNEIARGLARSNWNLTAGAVTSGQFRYPLRAIGEFAGTEELRHAVVGPALSPGRLTLADLGRVLESTQERQGLTRYNGEEVVVIQVRKEAGANTVTASSAVHRVLDQLRAESPGLRATVVSDQATFIVASIEDVVEALLIGALLAFLVLFFFLRNPRYPVVIGLTMTVSMAATLGAMYVFRISMNVISLTGLALGVGMLGDNAIMVIENVTRYRDLGRPAVEAVRRGTEEITVALGASTLTNVAVFLPVLAVEGVASRLFVDMAFTMTLSLLFSLVAAVTLVPVLILRPSASPAKAGRFVPSVAHMHERLANALDRYLRWALGHPGRVLGGTGVLALAAATGAALLPMESVPDLDHQRFVITIALRRGAALRGVSEFSGRCESALRALPEVEGVYAAIGLTEGMNIWAARESAIERATLEVRVRKNTAIRPVIERARVLLRRLQHQMDGCEVSIRPRETPLERILRPADQGLMIRIMGEATDSCAAAARALVRMLRTVPGLDDIRSSRQDGAPELALTVDREAARRFGVSVEQIAEHVVGFGRGVEATSFSGINGKTTIRVRPAPTEGRAIDGLLASTMKSGERYIPLRALVRCDRFPGVREIWRENQERAEVITAAVRDRSIAAAMEDVRNRIRKAPIPAGCRIRVGGADEELRATLHSLIEVLLLSTLLIYMILAAEYESIVYPLVILLTSPLAFIGAVAAMALAGQAYTVMSLVGLVIMVGAVDNDAVIAVDLITELRRAGATLPEAVCRGMLQRLRPILMTTATTVLGAIPLVVTSGTGSELARSLTIPVVGGLIASTALTMTTIPCVYCLIDRWEVAGTARGTAQASGGMPGGR